LIPHREFIELARIRALGMRCEIEDPLLGRTIRLGVPLNLTATPGRISARPPALPAGAEQTDDVFALPPVRAYQEARAFARPVRFAL
jgi:hypothetical protein